MEQVTDKIGGPCATRTHDQFLKRQVVRSIQPADRERIREAATFLIFWRLSGKVPSVGTGP